jgi:predicted RecA/RadA family phage recombinase
MALGFLTTAPESFSATAGDDWRLQVTLRDNGTAKDLSTATVSAALVDLGDEVAIAETAQSSGTTGATWASGVVVVAFDDAATDSLAAGSYRLKVQAIIGGVKTTWPDIAITVQSGI